MKIFVKAFNGCGMPKANIQRYRDFLLSNRGELVNHPTDSDVILLWTCAFRRDFRDNSLSEIKRYQREFDSELTCGWVFTGN